MQEDPLNLSAGLVDERPKPRRQSSRLPDLISFAQENSLAVGSTTGGTHNRGSKHYSGNAIDLKGSGSFSDEQVATLKQAADLRGFLLRDERQRPPGQKVWGGPHIHVEAVDGPQGIDLSAGIETKRTPGGTVTNDDDDPLNLSAGLEDANRIAGRRTRRPRQDRPFTPAGPFQRVSPEQQEMLRSAVDRIEQRKARSRVPDVKEILTGATAGISQPATFDEDRRLRSARLEQDKRANAELRKRIAAETYNTRDEEYKNFLLMNRAADSDRMKEQFLDLKVKQATQRGDARSVIARQEAEKARQARVAQMGTAERLAQVPKSVVGGFAEGVGTSLKFIAAVSRKINLGGEYDGKETTDLATYQLGEAITQSAKEILGSNPDLEQEFFVGKAPSTVGQVAQFMLGGWATKSPKLAVVILGSGMTAGDAYDEVRARGGTDEEAVNAALLAGGLLGPTELIGMRGAMRAISGTARETTFKAAMKTALREGRRDAIENALQEMGQEFGQGIITKNPRDLAQLIEAGTLGAIGGTATAPLTFAGSMPAPSRSRAQAGNVASDPLADLLATVQPATGATGDPSLSVATPRKPAAPAEPTKRPEDYLPSFFGVKQPRAEAAPSVVAKETASLPPAGEKTAKPAELTSLRRVDVNEDRRALGQPEFTSPERKAWQSTYDNAALKGYVRDARAISEGALRREDGASLSDEQVAGINLRLAELKNEHKAALVEGNGDKVDAIENEFNVLQTAADKAGSETARALNIRKATLNSDYQLITLLQRAKAKGIDITPTKRAVYVERAKKIAELEAQLDKAHLAPIQAKLDQIGRVKVRAETRAKLDVEYESLKRQLAAEFRVKVQPSGLAGIDPEGRRTMIVTKIIRNRVKAGYTDAVGLLDEVHGLVKGYGLSREDIKEYIRAEMETSPADRRRQTQLFKQEAELTRRLEQKDFSRTERQPIVYNKETVKLQGAIDKLKTKYETELHNAQITRKQRWAQDAFDVAMIPKSVMSSGDLSASLRQGGFHSLTHPVISAKAFAQSIAGITNVGHAKLKARIENHPDYDRAVRFGVEFTGLDNPNLREERFISNLSKDLPVIKHSERAFTGFLDTQRLQVFSKLSEGVKDPKALKALGEMINIASGRANIKPGSTLAKSMYTANLSWYSPRLVVSRFQLLNKMLNPVAMANMPREVRSRLIADNIKFVGMVATTMALASASGAEISLDPDSPDFLKLKYGNTRYDILLGLQQPLRLLINSMRAMYNYANGEPSKKSAGQLIGRFGRSKLSPEASYLVDWVNEKDYLGEPFSHKSALANRLSPLVFQDMYDAMKDEGFLFDEPAMTAKQGAKGMLKASPAFFGIGVSTYPPKLTPSQRKFRTSIRREGERLLKLQ